MYLFVFVFISKEVCEYKHIIFHASCDKFVGCSDWLSNRESSESLSNSENSPSGRPIDMSDKCFAIQM